MIKIVSRAAPGAWRSAWGRLILGAAMCLAAVHVPFSLRAGPPEGAPAPIALVVAVDVSQSVDERRYRLQMEGIAQALEDPGVLDVILSGSGGGILFSLVAWADRPIVAIPWARIASPEDAAKAAALVRGLPHQGGEFTCVARLLRYVNEVLAPHAASQTARLVVDISSDGIDNCGARQANDAARDALLASGATINGLPIFVAGENDVLGSGAYRAPGYDIGNLPLGPGADTTTLDVWFDAHVIGGPGAFLLPAQGYEDFGRAIRRKFVVEISGLGR